MPDPRPRDADARRAAARAAIRRWMASLAQIDRLLISLRWADKLAASEIAAALDLPADRVRVRLAELRGKARRIGREVVGAHQPPPPAEAA